MRKIVNRRIRRQGRSGSVVADVSVVISGNVGGRGGGDRTVASRRQKVRIVQRKGRTDLREG